jgi:hypothetical protein
MNRNFEPSFASTLEAGFENGDVTDGGITAEI